MKTNHSHQTIETPTDSSALNRRRFLSSALGFGVAGASALLLPHVASAQAAEPTLQETLDWIKGKVNEQAGWRQTKETLQQDLDGKGRIYTVSHDYMACEMKDGMFMFSIADTPDDEVRDILTLFIPLSKMNIQVRVKEIPIDGSQYSKVISGDRVVYAVLISATNDNKVIRYVIANKQGQTRSEEMVSMGAVEFGEKDEELANRCAKALSRLIKLSGGKEEAF